MRQRRSSYTPAGECSSPREREPPESYNSTMFRRCGRAAGIAGRAVTPTRRRCSHRAVAPISILRGRPAHPSAVVARRFAAAPRAGAAVLASYVTGQPFLVESPYGRGRVLLMTTTIDADWNTLPLTSFYLPFVQSAARHLALGAHPQRNLAPGQEIRARFTRPRRQTGHAHGARASRCARTRRIRGQHGFRRATRKPGLTPCVDGEERTRQRFVVRSRQPNRT